MDLYVGQNSYNKDAFVWNGNQNMTWSQLNDHLFEAQANFGSDFEYWLLENSTKKKIDMLLPFSSCIEIVNYNQILGVGSTNHSINIILEDPFRYLKYRVLKSAMFGEYMEVEKFADPQIKPVDSYFTIYTTVKNERPEKGFCTVYSTPDGFSRCVQVLFIKVIL